MSGKGAVLAIALSHCMAEVQDMEGLETRWGSLRPGESNQALRDALIEQTLRSLEQLGPSAHCWCSHGSLTKQLVEEALFEPDRHPGFQQLWRLTDDHLGQCPGCIVAFHRAQVSCCLLLPHCLRTACMAHLRPHAAASDACSWPCRRNGCKRASSSCCPMCSGLLGRGWRGSSALPCRSQALHASSPFLWVQQGIHLPTRTSTGLQDCSVAVACA